MWARRAYLTGVVLAVLLFIPLSSFPLIAGKITAVALCMLVAGALYAWAFWKGETEPLPGGALLLALLPLTYLLSFAFSANRAVGVIGTGIEADTLLFTTLAFLVAFLGAALFKTTAQVWMFVRTLFGVLALAAIFQTIVLLLGLPGPFTDRSVNLVGKWNDFGIVVLLLSFFVLLEMQFGRLSHRMRRGAAAALAVLLVLLGVVNFPVAWVLLFIIATTLAVIAWVSSRRVAWPPVVAGLVAVVFLFFGAALNAQLSKVIPVTALEIRPSIQSTVELTQAAHGTSIKNAALGTGPNTFGLSWLSHKPAEVNQSQFWNLDFSVGYSTLTTAFSSVGLFGALAWLLPAVLLLAGLWRTRRVTEGRLVLLTTACAGLLWWAVVVAYVPSPNLLLVAFATAGIAIGLLWHGTFTISARWLLLPTYVLLVFALVWTVGVSMKRFVAQIYIGQAAAALQSNDVDKAYTLAARSVSIERNSENLRLLTDIGAVKLQELAKAAKPDSQQAFTALLQQTIAAGQQALVLDNQDYRSLVSIGRVYDFLAVNKVEGAYANAKSAYAAAAALTPLSPALPLMQAKLEAVAGTPQGVDQFIKQALTLKPDYTDAILFLAQVDIARNDLASAIRDTQTAVKSAPGVPSVWLQLGLLYYAGGDTKNAIPPLEQALILQPDYANAQYFLGLSYAAEGRTQDAIALFAQLSKTNPDNAEVTKILKNLEAGRPALSTESAPAAADTTPVEN